jgi:hypothetical protein
MNVVLSAEQIVGPCAIRLREAAADAARSASRRFRGDEISDRSVRKRRPSGAFRGDADDPAKLFQPGANERSLA